MSLKRFTVLLEQRMGLDASSIGEAAVERAVRERTAASGCAGSDEYWERLSSSENEVQELIETVVVPETWFFRDREAFAALTRMTLGAWLPQHPAGVLRVLSLPCATGEEPYSIAMALLDAGLRSSQFRIDAVDISQRALAIAARAVFGKNSFRGAELGFRDRYFEPDGRAFRLREEVREPVRFQRANLFADGVFPESHLYDAIFCRNVLIYFNQRDRERAVRLLDRLLAPHGMLFVGPSESALLLDQGFVSTRIPLAFAFRPPVTKIELPRIPAAWPAGQPTSGPSAPARGAALPKLIVPEVRARTSRTPVREVPEAAASPRAALGEGWIEQAQRLADEGKLGEAIAVCERNLGDSPASAQAFYLMGLLHDAAGRIPQAIEHYRKALYLEPHHAEALVHLGTALMSHGDEPGARRLFERAKRARSEG